MRNILAVLAFGAGALAAEPSHFICTRDGPRLVVQTEVAMSTLTSNEWHAMVLPTNTVLVTVAEYATNRVLYPPPPPLPAQFPDGVAVPVPDANGHWMLIHPQADGEPVVAIQISDSPINPATWAARKAAALATNTVVVSTYRQTLRDIKSNLATNKVEIQAIDPTDSSAAGQKAQIQALKRELIDLLVEVQNLRQALARKEREE